MRETASVALISMATGYSPSVVLPLLLTARRALPPPSEISLLCDGSLLGERKFFRAHRATAVNATALCERTPGCKLAAKAHSRRLLLQRALVAASSAELFIVADAKDTIVQSNPFGAYNLTGGVYVAIEPPTRGVIGDE